jgi:hypothetical protein
MIEVLLVRGWDGGGRVRPDRGDGGQVQLSNSTQMQ